MVLMPPRRTFALPRPGLPGGAGVTLLELLIAISLSGLIVGAALALYRDVAGAAKLVGGRMDDDTEAQAIFNTLARNLMLGGGVLRIAPQSLALINVGGVKTTYAWEDSALLVNGNPRSFHVTDFRLESFGPPIPTGEDGHPDWNATPDLDSLDGNRDGIVDFDELDRDRDGELDMAECRYLSLVRVTMTAGKADPAGPRTLSVHPRNRARDST